MPDWTWKQGDEGPVLLDQLSFEGGGVPEEAALSLRLRSLTDATVVSTTGTAEWTDLTGGVMFTPSAADTSNPIGNYISEWVVSNQLGQVQTFPTDGFMWGRIEPNAATAPQLVISPLDIKELMKIPAEDRTRDAEFVDYIQSVTPLIEAEVGPLAPRLYEEWYDGGSNIIKLDHDPSEGFGTSPVLTLIAVSEYRGPIEYPLALVPSPAFGSIYSVMLIPQLASITRRSAGGRTLAFMPGRDAIHVLYSVGQNPIPANIRRAVMECVRIMYRWPQPIGRGSQAMADQMEAGTALQSELSRVIRMWCRPARRHPSIG